MDRDLMSDDYVANLLKQDAKISAARYLKTGLGALLPHKPNPNAPKPNTRFLRNIVQDADSHNAALLAKEKAESRARPRQLKEQEQGTRHDQSDRLRREDDGPRKRRRIDEDHELRQPSRARSRSPRRRRDSRRSDSDSDTRQHSTRGAEQRRRFPGLQRKERLGGSVIEDRRSDRCSGDGREGDSHRARYTRDASSSDDGRPKRQRSSGRKIYTDRNEDGTMHRDSRGKRRDPRSRSRSRSRDCGQSRHGREHTSIDRSHKHRKDRDRISCNKDASRKHSSSSRRKPSPSPISHPTSDSDPLESIVGPLPPPKIQVRGRGTTSSSTIDRHFATDYDPSLEPPADLLTTKTETWDEAVESFRDRQKWRQIGGERLKAAGFSETQVKTWQSGGSGEKDESDVVWRKEGEGPREWDRGKVLGGGGDGDVRVRAEWGRLSP